ncbi:unnamed protein product [Ixodes pacificus]
MSPEGKKNGKALTERARGRERERERESEREERYEERTSHRALRERRRCTGRSWTASASRAPCSFVRWPQNPRPGAGPAKVTRRDATSDRGSSNEKRGAKGARSSRTTRS